MHTLVDISVFEVQCYSGIALMGYKHGN